MVYFCIDLLVIIVALNVLPGFGSLEIVGSAGAHAVYGALERSGGDKRNLRNRGVDETLVNEVIVNLLLLRVLKLRNNLCTVISYA